MEKIIVVQAQEIEVEFTDEFKDNFSEFKEKWSQVFHVITSLEDYAEYVALQVQRTGYIHEPEKIEGIGKPFIKAWNGAIYKPHFNGGLRTVEKDEKPECGVIVKLTKKDLDSYSTRFEENIDIRIGPQLVGIERLK